VAWTTKQGVEKSAHRMETARKYPKHPSKEQWRLRTASQAGPRHCLQRFPDLQPQRVGFHIFRIIVCCMVHHIKLLNNDNFVVNFQADTRTEKIVHAEVFTWRL